MTTKTPDVIKAKWINAGSVYERFRIPRSLLRTLASAGTVRRQSIETGFGTMFIYSAEDCANYIRRRDAIAERAAQERERGVAY